MELTLKVLFYKKIKNKNQLYYYELDSSGRGLQNQLRSVMKKLVSIYPTYPKMEKGFVKYNSIELYCNGSKKETFFPLDVNAGMKINLEYILNFKWNEFTDSDLCKIIDLNFPFLIWSLKEDKRNAVRNMAKINNPFLLSNGQGLVKFNNDISRVITHTDPLFIKKSHYTTPINYRKR